ncbi:hypothetical protein D3C83_186510 [compost metagenome]
MPFIPTAFGELFAQGRAVFPFRQLALDLGHRLVDFPFVHVGFQQIGRRAEAQRLLGVFEIVVAA